MPLLGHEPSDEILAAFMRSCADRGYADLSPAECMQVLEFLIAECRGCEYRLGLRAMGKAWQDYRQWKDEKALRPWKELVASSLKRIVSARASELVSSREETNRREQELARGLFARFPSRAEKDKRDKEWTTEPGKSVDTLYRRKRNSRLPRDQDLIGSPAEGVAKLQNCPG